MNNFDFQPTLVGPALILRPLQPSDHAALFAAASDPLIWAGHPVTNRHEHAVFDPYFSFLQASGKAVVIIDRASDRIIGCSQFYATPTPAAHISIGYTFLARAFWGGKTNLQLKTLMLSHLFEQRDEAWFHIAPSNQRSQKATEKLGAIAMPDETLDLGTGPVLWRSYRLTKPDWAAHLAQAE